MPRTKLTSVFALGAMIAIGCSRQPNPIDVPEETGDPNDPSNDPNPMLEPERDPATCIGEFPEGCVANCAPRRTEGMRCSCEILNCEATEVACECDVGCFPDANGNVPADCDIQIGPDGAEATGALGDALGDCASQVSCAEENDLTTTVNCTVSNCEVIQPQEVLVDPVSPNAAPNAPSVSPQPSPQSSPASETADRQAVAVDVLFVVDNSASMGDDQMAAACAIDSFFNAVDGGGGTFRAAVLTTDLLGDDPTGQSNTTSSTYPCQRSGTNVSCTRSPGLVGLAGSCNQTVSCTCPPTNPSADTTCQFSDQGAWIDSADAAGRDLLRQLIVQGESGSWYEGGLEAAFQYFVARERAGTFDGSTPTEIVVIADEDSDGPGPGESLLCPFNSVSRNTSGLANFNPPAPTNGSSLAECKQDLINFYAYYFSSRNIVVHGLTYTQSCGGTNTEGVGVIYNGVISRTGGRVTSICDCSAFPGFFTDVGRDTAALSTQICLQGDPVPGTLTVTHTEGGQSRPVPESATDGWTYDPNTNCIVLNGSWVETFGSFQIDYFDQSAPPTDPVSVGCLSPTTPIAMPITLTCNGTTVPQSANDGWTFDPATTCFSFHGSWAESACSAFRLNPVVCGLSMSDPLVTEVFCGDQRVPNSTSDGWSEVPGHADCIGLYGSWMNATCAFTQTPKICPDLGGAVPASNTLELNCGGTSVPESTSDGWTFDATSKCFYLYGSWATASCQWAVSFIPSNNP
jgi:hypothetical protein